MKTIEAYQTIDNKVFTNLEEAEDHEYLLDLPLNMQKLYITTPLSPRELEVLELLIKTPLQTIDIAERLNITPRTIKAHCSSIYKKTNTHDRVSLIINYYNSIDINS